MSQDLPNIAVLLAAYNGMEWIEEQVNSILAQKNVCVTIFISVDLSTDGTDIWANQLAKEIENVIFLEYGDRFGGAGANFYRLLRDVDLKGFDYVSFSDQDDIWLEGKLERACSFISDKSCDVYSSDVIAFWDNGKQKLIKKSYPQKKYDHFFEAAGPGCTYVFNSKSAAAFQSFIKIKKELVDDISLHDWLAYVFCRENGFVWFIDNQPMMLYRQHNNNQVGINEGFKAYKKRFSLIRSRWYRTQVEDIASLVSSSPIGVNCYYFRVLHAFQFRRRLRDRLLIFFIILLGIY
ncbi:glycosyltransferase [Marinomonas arenicola]|uniref:Glycosyltransferase n=1 Tax=Marinomonas arenicola TaxID=569601 RepID=A0ABU9G7U2_9GAMM